MLSDIGNQPVQDYDLLEKGEKYGEFYNPNLSGRNFGITLQRKEPLHRTWNFYLGNGD